MAKLSAIRPRPSPGETSGSETITPLVSAREYQADEFAADRIIHVIGTLTAALCN